MFIIGLVSGILLATIFWITCIEFVDNETNGKVSEIIEKLENI